MLATCLENNRWKNGQCQNRQEPTCNCWKCPNKVNQYAQWYPQCGPQTWPLEKKKSQLSFPLPFLLEQQPFPPVSFHVEFDCWFLIFCCLYHSKLILVIVCFVNMFYSTIADSFFYMAQAFNGNGSSPKQATWRLKSSAKCLPNSPSSWTSHGSCGRWGF